MGWAHALYPDSVLSVGVHYYVMPVTQAIAKILEQIVSFRKGISYASRFRH